MTACDDLPQHVSDAIRWPLALTRLGMGAEAVVRAFWPLWSVLFAALAFLMLSVQDILPVELVWISLGIFALGAGWALVRGVRRFGWPSRAAALARLDATLPGHPILAAMDEQAIGAGDAASSAVWQAHQARMAARLKEARPAEPDLRVSGADPFALRYVALLALLVAVIFGSAMRVQSVSALGPAGAGLAAGPTWEGWLEPPRYTGLPSIYLNDIEAAGLDAPIGSRITLRFYGEVGALATRETVSGTAPADDAPGLTAQEFEIAQSGRIEIDGPGGRLWEITAIPDRAPDVQLDEGIEASFEGDAQIPFSASDDYAVVAGQARIELALDEIDRRYGLRIAPEPRAAIELPLPMPITGDRAEFSETLVENFSEHPWANLPVTVTLSASDDLGQTGQTAPEIITLPGRRFFDPMAAAIIEQRRALLWNRENAEDVALLLRAVSHRPDDVFRSATDYLRLRTILRRIEALAGLGLDDDQQTEIAQALWDLALLLEEGDLDDARERLERAQERLSEAMRNGASDQEIAELMQELRDATDDYLRQLSRQAQQDGQDQDTAQNRNMMEMSQSDLQAMMDRIQELMEQGRMAEAQEALDQLRQMMENMQVTQGQRGQTPGEQAMEGLGETLREQQDLSDQAFRDLQEQFNPGQQGEQGQGRQGQTQPGQPGQGQRGEGQGGQPGEGGETGQPQDLEDSLAERQRALRQELDRQSQNLPGAGTEAGDAAREALDRAEGAMEGAEEALRENDLAGAIDNQSEAMEALREGMRNLGDALAQRQPQQGQGQQGQAEGADPGRQRDPLGRSVGSEGQIGSDENLLQGEDVYRRARELLDEIRRRSGEGERPEQELEYLERLLDRF
ncbi:TIGR02302 family protein [Marivita sp. GX14005]|uniref:TIGR02302 family protein n=1 Tax=Marivita sp. GX14005 TaxID=2942276 RepID=UPI0020190956|nr:TIGR02302 family protein [Marivita sp. GX14005]MCL3881661.1 TIGR02302 family protein [Marivita sp. GX14005]